MNSSYDSDRITCPLCGSTHQMPELAEHTNNGVRYTLHECPTCKAQFWLPIKNPGASWYEHDARYSDRNADPILKPNKKHRDILNAVEGKPGRVLDVGCGVGNFLAFASARGWESWGIDFDQDAIRAGKEVFGLEQLFVMDLQELQESHPDLRFDLITFFDVFEHLDDHILFVQRVKALLAPGGRIALSVPYRHGWRWLLPQDLPPRHLTRWDEASLTTFFERHGFRITYMRRLPATLRYLILKFRFRYGAWASFGFMHHVKEREAAQSPVSTSVSRPQSRRVAVLGFLAASKDAILFGIPAFVVWLVLLPTRARYTDIYALAELQ